MRVGKRGSDSPHGTFLRELNSEIELSSMSCRSANDKEAMWTSRNTDGGLASQQGQGSADSIDGQSDSVASTEVEPTDRMGRLDCATPLGRKETLWSFRRNKNARDVIDDSFPSQVLWAGFTVALLGSQEQVAALKTMLYLRRPIPCDTVTESKSRRAAATSPRGLNIGHSTHVLR